MSDATVQTDPLLSVHELSVKVSGRQGTRTLVDKLSFSVGVERVGLVGESGSGKSLTARALLGLLRPPLEVSAARLDYRGQDLRAATARRWAAIRGSEIALVLQDPRHALNPVLTVGRQIDEGLRIRRAGSAAERRDRIVAMIEAVGLREPQRVMQAYPHQLSGGMGQRVMLAMMLINDPRLLIADEPTSALDAAVREQVLELMIELARSRRMGLLLISHDLHQVARYCSRALVMYRGRLVDACDARELADSSHPYTRTLWACRPGSHTYGTMLPVLDRDAIFGGTRE